MCEAQGFVFTADMFEDEIQTMTAEMPGMEKMLDEYAEGGLEVSAEETMEQYVNCWKEMYEAAIVE